MSDLFTKAAKVKTTSKLWVIGIVLLIMVNIPYVDSHYQPTPIAVPIHSPSVPVQTSRPPVGTAKTRSLKAYTPVQPNPQSSSLSSVAGSYTGSVHNETAALSADFAIKVYDSGGNLSGFMSVRPPLYGSGPLEGSVNGSSVTFAVTSPIGTITFLGTRSENKITGTYTVEHTAGLKGSGTFVLRSGPSVDTAAPLLNKLESAPVPASSQPLKPLSAVSAGVDTQPSIPGAVDHSDPKNLSYCLNGYVPCNRGLLTPEESAQVAASDRRRNLSYCLNGYVPCNRSLLTPEESAQVAASDRRRNLSYCLNGYVPCNRSLLTPEESAQVAASDRRRNLSYCLNGYVPCNRSLLTPEESAQVAMSERRRNLSYCLIGYASCNPNLLTPGELAEVQARYRQRHH